MIIVIIALHEHLATSTYPSSSSPTQQMSTSSTYLLVNVIVVTSPSSSCFRCSPPWTWSSSDHPTQRKLLKISKECENMGPALPSGATHSRFSEGKEYRGAADPEKARCHLKKKKNAFWCRIGFIWHHNRQKQYVLRFSLSASATPVSNCIRTGQWSNSFWDNTRQRGVVLFGLILRRHYKQFISLEF